MQMAEKSIGQIGYEAYHAATLRHGTQSPFHDRYEIIRDHWEAAASAVWDQAVEACISIVAEGVKWEPEEFYSDTHIKASNETAYLLAKALRSLKRSQSQTGTDDLCQAKSSTQGETVSAPAEPLQSTPFADASEVWKLLASERRRSTPLADEPKMRVCGFVYSDDDFAHITDPLWALDRLVRDWKAANSQSPIEEAHRADTESAASDGASLTHKPLPPSPLIEGE
jgi:hypothetical protein